MKSHSCTIYVMLYCWQGGEIVEIFPVHMLGSGCGFTRAVCTLDLMTRGVWWPAFSRAGRGSRWCSRRDSGHRDGRKRRELLGRVEERFRRDEEPGGPLQRPALRGQERTRWTEILSLSSTHPRTRALSRSLSQTHTHTQACTHTVREVCL